MPLGVLIPAPAITIMFLHLSPLIRFTISSSEFTAVELRRRTWLDFGFLGDVLLDLDGGWGLGVIESFLNEETNPVSDWLPTMRLVLCLGRLRGLAVLCEPLLETLRDDAFLGDAKGKR